MSCGHCAGGQGQFHGELASVFCPAGQLFSLLPLSPFGCNLFCCLGCPPPAVILPFLRASPSRHHESFSSFSVASLIILIFFLTLARFAIISPKNKTMSSDQLTFCHVVYMTFALFVSIHDG